MRKYTIADHDDKNPTENQPPAMLIAELDLSDEEFDKVLDLKVGESILFDDWVKVTRTE